MVDIRLNLAGPDTKIALAAAARAVAAMGDVRDDALAASAAAATALLAEAGATSVSNLFPDTTAGLAATVEGGYFWVVGSGELTIAILYRKVSGVAVEQKRNLLENNVALYSGADPSGDNESTSAFHAAQSAGDLIVVNGGRWAVNFEVLTGKNWLLTGGAVLIPANTALPVVTLDGVDDCSMTGHWGIDGGNGAPSTYADRYTMYDAIADREDEDLTGVLMNVVRRTRISGLTVRRLNGAGLSMTGGQNHIVRHDNVIEHYRCFDSVDAIRTKPDDTSAEYTVFSDIIACRNKRAVVSAVGNLVFATGNLTDNGTGFDVVGRRPDEEYGANNGHGVISAFEANHNFDDNFRFDSIVNGYTVVASHNYGEAPDGTYTTGQGKTIVIDSKGVFFWSCQMGGPVFIDGPEAHNGIVNCYLPNPSIVGPFYENELSIRPQMTLRGNATPNGAWDENQQSDVYVLAERATTEQDLTSGDFTTAALFNNIVADWRGSWGADDYVAATGIFTARRKGRHLVLTRARFSGTSLTGGVLHLKKNASYTQIAPIGVAPGAIEAMGEAYFPIHLEVGDQLSIHPEIYGSSLKLKTAGSIFEVSLAQ